MFWQSYCRWRPSRPVLLSIAVAGLLLIGMPQLYAVVDFRWFLLPAMNGTLVAGIENKRGSYLRVSCSTGLHGGPSLDYEPKAVKLSKAEPIQIVVGKKVTFFELGASGLADLDTRGSRLQLEELVRNLIEINAPTLVVELPRLGSSEVFSTKDAAKSLRSGKETLVDPCEGFS